MRDFDEHKDKIWLDATDLETVENGRSGMKILSDHEKKLLRISSQKRARNEKIRKMIWGIGSAMILLIIVSAIIAWSKMNEAKRQEKIARVNYLTLKAEEVLNTDKTKAIRIAQAAYDLVSKDPPPHVLRLMHNIVYNQDNRYFYMNLKHNSKVISAVFSPDGSKILTTSDNLAKLWTITGDSIAVFKHNCSVFSAVFSPDNKKIRIYSGTFRSLKKN